MAQTPFLFKCISGQYFYYIHFTVDEYHDLIVRRVLNYYCICKWQAETIGFVRHKCHNDFVALLCPNIESSLMMQVHENIFVLYSK